MSSEYVTNKLGQGPWSKLALYILFRYLSEGLWINCSPRLWYSVILEPEYKIRTMVWDFGGDLTEFTIEAFEDGGKRKDEILYKLDLHFDPTHPESVSFVNRMENVYSYMKTYAGPHSIMEGGKDIHGKGRWFERAEDPWREEDRETRDKYGGDTDRERWNKVFGPLENIGKIESVNSYEKKSVLHEHEIPYEDYFNLLDNLKNTDDDIKVGGKTAASFIRCREWALFALLEMQRYYYGSC